MSANPHHDRMVLSLAQYFVQMWGLRITGIALEGKNRPQEVYGYIPDVEAIDMTRQFPVYGEAEECETYTNEHTRRQLEAFSSVTNARVYLCVPVSCFAAARAYIQRTFAGRNIVVVNYDGK